MQRISQRGQRLNFDALIIGSGISGLVCALELAKLSPHATIALITKAELRMSNTYYAQGGVAAAFSNADISQHIQDTLQAGDQLSLAEVVTKTIEQGPECIDYLVQQGVPLQRNRLGQLICSQEAGHSGSRIFYSGDHTGASIIDALVKQVRCQTKIHVFEHHTAVNLITQREIKPESPPEALGAYILEESSGLIYTFLAHLVVLATGGAGKVYRYTSNPETATGDGVALAYRAGARVQGLEFYQFHPTLLYHKDKNNFLLSETLRGEGAYLRCPKTSERFMQHYSADKMELATRDIVARAIFNEIEQGAFDYVNLDIRHQSKAFLQKRFPIIYQTLLKVGLDLSCDLIPVVPAAHYMGGGILTNLTGQTDIKRLIAIGETAYTGLHGGNRLAGNALLEGLVMARTAAKIGGLIMNNPCISLQAIADWHSTAIFDRRRASQITGHWRGLRGEMSAYAGIIRTATGLQDLLKLVLTRKAMVEDYYWQYRVTRDLIELRNIIQVAELIILSALRRRESYGGHYREDVLSCSTELTV